MTLNESSENYLEMILMLSKKLPVVRSVDIAENMGFKKSSVSVAMKHLREDDYITVTKPGFIYLTDKGRELPDDGQRLFPAPDRCGPGSGGTDLRKAPFFYRPADRGRRRPGNGGKGRLPDGA